jgi:hypothetical protein
MANRVGGIIRVSVDGSEVRAKGDFTWNLGLPKNEPVIGAGYPHGFKSVPQNSMIEGAVTDTSDLDLVALVSVTDSTVILELPNGKSIVLRQAYYAGEGEGTTQEGEVKVKWESPFPAEVLGGSF